jgi:hypothetical protein
VRPFVWQSELDQDITDFYVDATVAIGPINWQFELDRGITEFYVDANFAIGPNDWQLELAQGITEFVRGSQLCHRTNRLAIRIRNMASLIFMWTPTLPSDQLTGG